MNHKKELLRSLWADTLNEAPKNPASLRSHVIRRADLIPETVRFTL